MRKTIPILAVLGALVATGTGAQAQAPAAPTCQNQYTDADGVNPAGLLSGGFEIRGAVPGGVWLQKGKEAYYCNSGRPLDTDKAICWSLRVPVKGSTC